MMVALPSAQRTLAAWSPERDLGADKEAGGPGSEDRGMQVAECALSVWLGPWSRREARLDVNEAAATLPEAEC